MLLLLLPLPSPRLPLMPLPLPPAIAWLAESQPEERRECEPRSGSKPLLAGASDSCRLKSAASASHAVDQNLRSQVEAAAAG